MLGVDYNFSEWLLNQLNSRGWTQAELARRAGVSRTAISDVISDKHSAGFELCLAISRALNLPPETVFRAAGLLPPVSPAIALSEEVMYLLQKLPVEEQERFLALLRFEVERQAKKPPTKPPKKTSPTSRAEKPARSALKEE
ncbi:predicted transcriptional regulators [Bellilinea caldifistulae]|uniref:HTH cro/C1-type domain-containing protein n=1 Tax=Bellilinea caldifistulae TaxID=360411 RepID=A0A0P6WWC4_9CHLR|nr:helix-turn-helix transcriptional regulator [Bellilinea caldifistulae]KPL74568.1 hypothetical protein AC812_12290 [Bellilinea caldifistulae]GAP11783.1 predicted transcriptional regulators [Bellilinea caldifistulae]